MYINVLFYSLTIFLSSFLLFQIQPIISKFMLPYFGGSSSVWITAMLFFQTGLLLGYFYVVLISQISFKKQIFLHTLIFLLISYFIVYKILLNQTPILPAQESLFNNPSPVLGILTILFVSVGFPYFLLSTTSVLLQKWFGFLNKERSPYILYSLSNGASLIALISYPFLIEPYFSLKTQANIWSYGFIFYSFLLLLSIIQSFYYSLKIRAGSSLSKNRNFFKRLNKQMFIWVLLSFISSLMLLSQTALLTQSVAPVPFLWLLPFSLYLISFIITFSGRWYFRNFYAYLFLFSCIWGLIFVSISVPALLLGILVYSLSLFSACMLCHGELYRLKPVSKYLDSFYLSIALGGALGGVFAAIIAPLFFKGFWEIYIGFYLTYLLSVAVLVFYKNSFFYIFFVGEKRPWQFGQSEKKAYFALAALFPFVLTGTAFFMDLTAGFKDKMVFRSFYGVLTIKKLDSEKGKITYLTHGNIVHGSQFSGNFKYEPTTYYSKKSGIGVVLDKLSFKKNLNISVIGLGAGTLAAYGREGDSITFFEINPQVLTLAKSQFSYLKDSKAKIETIIGDGRLSLEKFIKQDNLIYDLVVVDAFSDDSIPYHLMTKEAFEIYLKSLTREGILAVHISNKYIDLKPVILGLAKNLFLHFSFINSEASDFGEKSEWAFLSKDKEFIESLPKEQGLHIKNVSLWTDQYSNLFGVLKY